MSELEWWTKANFLETENNRLGAENARLRKALIPFADESQEMNAGENFRFHYRIEGTEYVTFFDVNDLRAAYAALASKVEQE